MKAFSEEVTQISSSQTLGSKCSRFLRLPLAGHAFAMLILFPSTPNSLEEPGLCLCLSDLDSNGNSIYSASSLKRAGNFTCLKASPAFHPLMIHSSCRETPFFPQFWDVGDCQMLYWLNRSPSVTENYGKNKVRKVRKERERLNSLCTFWNDFGIHLSMELICCYHFIIYQQ